MSVTWDTFCYFHRTEAILWNLKRVLNNNMKTMAFYCLNVCACFKFKIKRNTNSANPGL